MSANNKKYKYSDVKDFIESNGFVLISDSYINCHSHLIIQDMSGYKYYITFYDFKRGVTPCMCSPYNPYSIDNIRLYLTLSGSGTEIISDEYKNGKSKLKFKCKCGSVFYMSWFQLHSRNKFYCNECMYKNGQSGRVDMYAKVKEKCDRLGYMLLTDCIPNAKYKFDYICKKHGLHTTTYDKFILADHSCKECGIECFSKRIRTNEDDIAKLAQSKGFEYVGVDYSNHVAIVSVICPKHKDKGIQKIYLSSLKKQNGCGYCAGKNVDKIELQHRLDKQNSHINIVDFTKYSEPILVSCKDCGYTWYTKGTYLSSGIGCKICKMSKYEKLVEKILKENGIRYVCQHQYNDLFDKNYLRFDFYLPQYNVEIEVDGEGHDMVINYDGGSHSDALHNFIQQAKRDVMKTNYCINNDIKLIRINWRILQHGYDTTKTYLMNNLNKYIEYLQQDGTDNFTKRCELS